MRTAWTTSTRGAAALLAAAAGLVIGGCAGGPADLMTPAAQRGATPAASEPGSSAVPEASPSSTLVAPLTGLPATGARAAGRPAVALPLSGGQLRALGLRTWCSRR